MTGKRIWASVALVLILCFALMVIGDVAYAQGDTKAAKSSDKKVATRQGVDGALADGPKDSPDGPTKLQMAVGLGSIVVMIAVVKWL